MPLTINLESGDMHAKNRSFLKSAAAISAVALAVAALSAGAVATPALAGSDPCVAFGAVSSATPGVCEVTLDTTATTWTVPTGVTSIDVLSVGGGGGGGGISVLHASGGGGGGQVNLCTQTVSANDVISIQVGAGGAAGTPAAFPDQTLFDGTQPLANNTGVTDGASGGNTTVSGPAAAWTCNASGGTGGQANADIEGTAIGGNGGSSGINLGGLEGVTGSGGANFNARGGGGAGASIEMISVDVTDPNSALRSAGSGSDSLIDFNITQNFPINNIEYVTRGGLGGWGVSPSVVNNAGLFGDDVNIYGTGGNGGASTDDYVYSTYIDPFTTFYYFLGYSTPSTIAGGGAGLSFGLIDVANNSVNPCVAPETAPSPANYFEPATAGIDGLGSGGGGGADALCGSYIYEYFSNGADGGNGVVKIRFQLSSVTITATPTATPASPKFGESISLTPSYSGALAYTAATDPTCQIFQTGTNTLVSARPVPVGTYDTKCSGGYAGAGYAFSFSGSSITVSQATPALAYTGATSLNVGTSYTPSSSNTAPAGCTGALAYSLSANPLTGAAGAYTLGSAPISTTAWLAGTYAVTVTYPGDANCAQATSTPVNLVVSVVSNTARSGKGSGTYNLSSVRSIFNFEIENHADRGGRPAYLSGGVSWSQANKWMFAGNLTSVSCSNTNPIVCAATGTGTLKFWKRSGWVSVTNGPAVVAIQYTASTMSGREGRASGGTFGIGFTGTLANGSPALPVLPMSLSNLASGSIKIN